MHKQINESSILTHNLQNFKARVDLFGIYVATVHARALCRGLGWRWHGSHFKPKVLCWKKSSSCNGCQLFYISVGFIVMVGAFPPLRGPIYCLQLVLWNKGIELATLQPEQFSTHCTCVHI